MTGGDKKFILHKGEIAFHEPNEFHNVTATGTIAPNLIVISFQCDDNAIYYFRKKILKMDDVERNLLASIIFEARHTFQCRLDDPYLQNMPLKQPPDIFGSQQMIRLLIEQFFNPPCKTLLSLLHQRCPSKRHYACSQINKIQK